MSSEESRSLSSGTQRLIASGWTWAQVPNMETFLTANVSDGARVLLVYMCWRRSQEGALWPSVRSMAQDLGVSSRVIHRRLRELETEELIRKTERPGRTSLYHVGEGMTKMSHPNGQGVTESSDLGVTESSYELSASEPYPDTTSGVPSVGASAQPSPAPPRKRSRDPRIDHPAIQAVRRLVQRYPKKPLWDPVIKTLGEAPDSQLLEECYVEWLARGYNGNSLKWALEWYPDGGPPKGYQKQEREYVDPVLAVDWVKAAEQNRHD